MIQKVINPINNAHIKICHNKGYWFKIRMEFLRPILAKIEPISQQPAMSQLGGVQGRSQPAVGCTPLLMTYFTEKNHNIWDRGEARGRLLLVKIVGCFIPCSINWYGCIGYIYCRNAFQLRLCLSGWEIKILYNVYLLRMTVSYNSYVRLASCHLGLTFPT